jgi:hypothetical protein
MRSGVALAILLVLVAPRARAGCPNVCDLIVSQATIDPPIACLTVKPTAETCDCGVFLTVTNGCTDTVSATDFLFTSCGPVGGTPTGNQCPSVSAGQQGVDILTIPASSGTGPKSLTLHLEEAGVASTLTIMANVSSFGAGCACSVPARGGTPGGSLALVLAGVATTAARRRRPRAATTRSTASP